MKKSITRRQLIDMYIGFMIEHGHKNIGSASIIPENDATILFTTAGMHPLVPYLLGEKHPAGTRLTNAQKCIRTNDIDEVGDNSHLTMFEMLGNWSLGDYFKSEMIPWSYEFLTSEKYLGIPLSNFAVTVFEGDDVCPRDTESAEIWRQCGVKEDRIFFLPKSENWWGLANGVGPCGPDTEMFFDNGQPPCCPECSPMCNCGKYMEMGNDVFLQYYTTVNGGEVKPLQQKNVDTGMGLERMLCLVNGKNNVYATELFENAIKIINSYANEKYEDAKNKKPYRVICDHIRSATIILGDDKGIVPSNVGQGYVLRRLLRRSIRFALQLQIDNKCLVEVSNSFIEYFGQDYQELVRNRDRILKEIQVEINKFEKTLKSGQKEWEKATEKLSGTVIDGQTAFHLYDTFGFPIELTLEMAREKGLEVDMDSYAKCFAEHQQKSKMNSDQLFKGGLSDTSKQTANLHTATHLLLGALRRKFGNHIEQRGSNITPDRLRFDFNFDRKITPEELKEIEEMVNEAIDKQVDVVCETLSIDEARKSGAMGIFNDKYGDSVKVFTIEGYSKEICGGPHASNTSDLGHFEIVKEESSSSGIRRIKAIIKNAQ